ncbi:hypothetical protein ACFQ1M_11885 [Sungkyunkwania multivorans]|uniref:GIY-YIG homing endonuclease n=1 Tax=Sungkyunkwania multivorans TaxID=1173618 RepID=A0ABW3D1F7_9FLAO
MLKVQNIITQERLIKQYNLDVGKVFFYENYLITEIAEGTCFGFRTAKELTKLVHTHFKGRSFGYISHRINSYSVVPTDYLSLKETFPNLEAFAVVAYDEVQLLNIDIENIFFSGNIKSFVNLNHASNWVLEKLGIL